MSSSASSVKVSKACSDCETKTEGKCCPLLECKQNPPVLFTFDTPPLGPSLGPYTELIDGVTVTYFLMPLPLGPCGLYTQGIFILPTDMGSSPPIVPTYAKIFYPEFNFGIDTQPGMKLAKVVIDSIPTNTNLIELF
jgi:hypothetical protein